MTACPAKHRIWFYGGLGSAFGIVRVFFRNPLAFFSILSYFPPRFLFSKIILENTAFLSIFFRFFRFFRSFFGLETRKKRKIYKEKVLSGCAVLQSQASFILFLFSGMIFAHFVCDSYPNGKEIYKYFEKVSKK